MRLVVVGEDRSAGPCSGLLPRAVFTGRVVGEELGDLVASLDLLVHPGADETFCQAVQEALAAGVPAWWRRRAGRWTWSGTGRTAGCGPATTRRAGRPVAGLRDDRRLCAAQRHGPGPR